MRDFLFGLILFVIMAMSLSYFYIQQYDLPQKEVELDEDTSHHIVQVLRMKTGERLQSDRWERKFADGGHT